MQTLRVLVVVLNPTDGLGAVPEMTTVSMDAMGGIRGRGGQINKTWALTISLDQNSLVFLHDGCCEGFALTSKCLHRSDTPEDPIHRNFGRMASFVASTSLDSRQNSIFAGLRNLSAVVLEKTFCACFCNPSKTWKKHCGSGRAFESGQYLAMILGAPTSCGICSQIPPLWPFGCVKNPGFEFSRANRRTRVKGFLKGRQAINGLQAARHHYIEVRIVIDCAFVWRNLPVELAFFGLCEGLFSQLVANKPNAWRTFSNSQRAAPC